MSNMIELLAPLIEMVIYNVLKNLFTTFVHAQPIHAKVVLASMYPGVDGELEPLIEGTPTKLDDAAVKAIKRAIEDVAAECGLVLSNVDND